MHVFTNRWRGRYRLDHAIAEVVGVRAREAKATNPIDTSNRAKQIGEVVRAVGVGIHGLTEQHDLRYSVRDYAFGLTHDVRKRATTLRTTRVGHYAIRAPVVTSALHRDPGLHLVEPARLEILVMLFHVEVRRRRPESAARVIDQSRQCTVSVRADHDAHMRSAFEQLWAQPLSHAPGHSHHCGRRHVSL